MNETAREHGARRGRRRPRVETPRRPERDLELARRAPEGPPAVLVVNKVDRVKDKTQLLPVLAAFARGARLRGHRPDERAGAPTGPSGSSKELRELLPEQPFLYEPDTLSDQPVRFFVAEFVREQILAHTRQEVPHGVAVVVERFDEGGDVPHIEIAVHVAREAHKGILVGAQGQHDEAHRDGGAGARREDARQEGAPASSGCARRRTG